MRRDGLPELAIRSFEYYYGQLVAGETGLLPENVIRPVEHLPAYEDLGSDLEELGAQNSARVAVLKLNGGLGTTMGLDKAKSLLPVKGELTFLDLIARQAIQGGYGLLLMNSFSTEADSLRLLERYGELRRDLPISLLQHHVPKVRKIDLAPVECPTAQELEWCPPGHGDLFNALRTRGVLESLLRQGIRYLFVSNADNLTAVLDHRILGYLVRHRIPFLMEVADRTEADRKGGHLAYVRGPRETLVLRESAQCPSEDLPSFQDIRRHKYFNTNNLWIDLEVFSALMAGDREFLRLPLIRNEKTVDPACPDSTPVYQLETAAGAAIAVFPGARAIRVPRSRFAPVKTCGDLLTVRSDYTKLDGDWKVVPHPERDGMPPFVDLDPRYFQFLTDLEARFPDGAPSMVRCRTLRVEGDFIFGSGVVCVGDVLLRNHRPEPVRIPDGAVLEGGCVFSEPAP